MKKKLKFNKKNKKVQKKKQVVWRIKIQIFLRFEPKLFNFNFFFFQINFKNIISILLT
jgi:hypothetical protein